MKKVYRISCYTSFDQFWPRPLILFYLLEQWCQEQNNLFSSISCGLLLYQYFCGYHDTCTVNLCSGGDCARPPQWISLAALINEGVIQLSSGIMHWTSLLGSHDIGQKFDSPCEGMLNDRHHPPIANGDLCSRCASIRKVSNAVINSTMLPTVWAKTGLDWRYYSVHSLHASRFVKHFCLAVHQAPSSQCWLSIKWACLHEAYARISRA